jgi:hypothetical protein
MTRQLWGQLGLETLVKLSDKVSLSLVGVRNVAGKHDIVPDVRTSYST